MEQADTRSSVKAKIVVAFLAAVVAFALLFFWGGGRGFECVGMFGWYTVPCDARVTWAAAAMTGAVAFLALRFRDRRG